MTATMTNMEWRIVDTLAAYQLEAGDYFLGVEGDIVEIYSVDEHIDKVVILWLDDYGDVYAEEKQPLENVAIYMLFDDE